MSSLNSTISLSDAQQILERSIAAAAALDVPCSIAVVDSLWAFAVLCSP